MSKPADIYNGLQSGFQNSAFLSYMDKANVFLGLRQSFDNYPAICIEEGKTNPESSIDFNTFVDVEINIPIFIFVKPFDKDKQISGDAGTVSVGSADILNDVKKQLMADRTLGGECIDISIGAVDPLLENWPTRTQQIMVTVKFRQNITTRA